MFCSTGDHDAHRSPKSLHLNSCTSLTWSPWVFGPLTSRLIHLNDFSSPEVLNSGVQTNHLHFYPHAYSRFGLYPKTYDFLLFHSYPESTHLTVFIFLRQTNSFSLFLEKLPSANPKLQCPEDAN